MNAQQEELYQNIQKFSLDDADAVLSFTPRLAKDNGWTIEYSQRVINEYKKFAFLAMIAGHPVSPSSQVDQAWHLHLTYTHSYWDDFCGKILHKPLHHNPSLGGYSEQEKFRRWYEKTLISYEKIFNELPPIDIWPLSNIRFAQNVQYQRINTRGYWIIPKPSLNFLRFPGLKAILIALLSSMLVLAMSSFFPLLANTHNYSNNWNSSEFVISQVAENNLSSGNTPTSNLENNQTTSDEASELWWLWWLLILIGFLCGSGNSNGGDNNNNNNCSGCACSM
ncbi:hypothetical protein IQ226_13445 [Dolichospermum sp. LEGE 00240]|jgi:hypothetical protein|uniref:glycine-rich domain-containing protein n=1 Tax=Dolichospermum sp. LEGE 00240 TaxID=1828603 RepID=UPI001881D4FE|nr:hypothetical protein [Dolichospermum sp. LEGE 00240]MBE9250136.1 hypothetical protein [Dolichospermum sp. LEGE 00240]MDM3847122.1 hypothetical protein [Aphanizomenon gracile PMC638.10]MDM3863046.1 hypothetical protein [Aphanizomenon gracile PMC644.10]